MFTTLGELKRAIDDAITTAGEQAAVAIIDVNSSIVSSVTSVEVERHDDADGSWTAWLKIEES